MWKVKHLFISFENIRTAIVSVSTLFKNVFYLRKKDQLDLLICRGDCKTPPTLLFDIYTVYSSGNGTVLLLALVLLHPAGAIVFYLEWRIEISINFIHTGVSSKGSAWYFNDHTQIKGSTLLWNHFRKTIQFKIKQH